MSVQSLKSKYKVFYADFNRMRCTCRQKFKICQNEGLSSQKQNLKTSEWVLKRIYQIQQNSKFRNSLKINTYE